MIRWEIKMCCCWFLIGSLAHLKELSDLSSGPLGKIDADVQLYWLISSVKAELFSGGFQTVLLPFSPIKSLEIYFTNKTTTACIPLCLSSRVEDHHATLLIWAILSLEVFRLPKRFWHSNFVEKLTSSHCIPRKWICFFLVCVFLFRWYYRNIPSALFWAESKTRG